MVWGWDGRGAFDDFIAGGIVVNQRSAGKAEKPAAWIRGDQSRARAGCAAANLSPLRRLALNRFKRERTKTRGSKGKPRNAGSNPSGLLRPLGVPVWTRSPCGLSSPPWRGGLRSDALMFVLSNPFPRGSFAMLAGGLAILTALTRGYAGEPRAAPTARLDTAKLHVVIADNEIGRAHV
jgi:hypothetical protein